jgi:hypothetical protein
VTREGSANFNADAPEMNGISDVTCQIVKRSEICCGDRHPDVVPHPSG